MRTKITLSAIIITSACAAMGLTTAAPVTAQTGGLIVAPAAVELRTQPQKPTSFQLQVFNSTNTTKTLSISASTLAVNNQTDEFESLPGQPVTDYLTWDKFPNQVLQIAPGQREDLTFQFSPHQNIAPGAHYLAIYFRDVKTTDNDYSGSSTVAEIGIPVLLTMETSAVYQSSAELVAPQMIQLGTEVDVIANIQNTGNSYFTPVGVINANPVLGISTGKKINFNDQQQKVFNGDSRAIATNWNVSSAPLFGLYDLELVYAYGPTNKVQQATARVLILPWPFLLFVGISLALLGWLSYRRYSVHRAQRSL